MSLEKKATFISSSVAFLLTLMKISVGILSGSVALLSSAVDSLLDFAVSIFNYFALSLAEKPADSIFNYGRGKIEALASVIEGTIISFSGLFLLYHAIKKYITGETSNYLDISIVVMIVSLVVTFLLVLFLNYVAKKTNNLVIKADALHYKTDIITNLAVLVSLVLVYFTKIEFIDVLVGAVIAIYIIYSAYDIIKEGVLILLDRSLDEEIVEKIKDILKSDLFEYSELKTRESGKKSFVDVYLIFKNKNISLEELNKINSSIEEKIKNIDDRVWVLHIHNK